MQAPIEVREVTPADVDEVGAVVARAFEHDPLLSWLFPDARTRVRRVTAMERLVMRKVAMPVGRHLLTTSDRAGLASWAPPGTWQVPMTRFVRVLPRLVPIMRSGLVRLGRGFAVLDQHHPHEPHWYLEGLATDPPRQRRGIGAALMAPVLARCDAEGVGAYLETQQEANVPYYRRHGFDVIDEVDLPARGPHMWLMWRDPGSTTA